MTVEKVFVDLDRTIFDTPAFFEAAWDTVGRIRGIDTTVHRKRAANYYAYNRDLYNYEFFRHLSAEGLEVDAEALVAELRRPGRFIYADVMPTWPLLSGIATPKILTYGGADYQQLKIASCPELDAVEVVAVLEPKAEYFMREMPEKPVILLDDKDLAAELPPHVRFIRVNRANDAPLQRGHGGVVINSFIHVKEALELL